MSNQPCRKCRYFDGTGCMYTNDSPDVIFDPDINNGCKEWVSALGCNLCKHYYEEYCNRGNSRYKPSNPNIRVCTKFEMIEIILEEEKPDNSEPIDKSLLEETRDILEEL